MLSFKAKLPALEIIYGGDLKSQLAQRPAGTTITSVACQVLRAIGGNASGAGALVVDNAFLFNGTIVSAKCSGGTPGVTYVLQFLAPLSNGETIGGTIALPVANSAPV